jgi:hypothetical protein
MINTSTQVPTFSLKSSHIAFDQQQATMSLKEKDLKVEQNERVPPPSLQIHMTITTHKPQLSSAQNPALNIQTIINDPSPSQDPKETRRIIRKIDLRLLPTLAVIYAFALIDRVNLPNVPHPHIPRITRTY